MSDVNRNKQRRFGFKKMIEMQANNPNNHSGFTLVEVLISVVVLSIGMLGLAGLQTVALRQNNSSNMRSQVVELMNDISDRMRANKVGADANAYAVVNGVPADPGFDCMTDFSGTASGTSCSAQEMAQLDAFAWQTAVGRILPVGAGTVICTDSTDPGFTDADNNGVNDADTDANPCTAGSRFIISLAWNDRDPNGPPGLTTFSVTFLP